MSEREHVKFSILDGRHPVQGFTDTADETAREAVAVAAVPVAGNPGVGGVGRQSGGDHPGFYVAHTTGAGGLRNRIDAPYGFDIANLLSPTGDGGEIDQHAANLIGGAALGDPGNPDYLLPESTSPGLRRGDRATASFVLGPGETATLTAQGTDQILVPDGGLASVFSISGLDSGTFAQSFEFLFLGDPGSLLGVNVWAVIPAASFDVVRVVRNGFARIAEAVTTQPLPAFTPSGSGAAQILTANANGALMVEGVALGVGDLLLVASEQGADRQWHGLWRVTQEGDGSNPWILTVDSAWRDPGFANDFGSIIWVEGSGQQRARGAFYSFSGKTFVGGGVEQNALKIGKHRVFYVKYATTAPLDAFTSSGSGAGQTLTANANGALTVDGIAVVVGNSILVASESGTDRTFHGVYDVEATGDGSNPWVLRRRYDWANPEDVDDQGAVVLITGTDANANTPGRAYVWPGSFESESDFFVVRSREKTFDLGSQAATVAPDLRLSKNHKVTLTGNATLTPVAAGLAIADGMSGYIHVTQDGTGTRTLTPGTGVDSSGGVFTLSAVAGQTDVLAYIVEGSTMRAWVAALNIS